MSIIPQNIFTTPHSRINSFYLKNPNISTPLQLKPLKIPLILPTQKNHLQKIQSLQCHQWKVKAFESDGTVKAQSLPEYEFNFDAFLSILEFLCLLSSAVVAISFALNSCFLVSQKWLGNRVLGVQCVVLVSGVIIGSVIRRRQWKRICMNNFSRSGSGSKGINLLERIEKLEEDLRSSATIIRVLSRQLEKLGIRFRVTRKTLKDPMTETATLAQKNSEATRALAMQGEHLEKELGEIQKVLLAMQACLGRNKHEREEENLRNIREVLKDLPDTHTYAGVDYHCRQNLNPIRRKAKKVSEIGKGELSPYFGYDTNTMERFKSLEHGVLEQQHKQLELILAIGKAGKLFENKQGPSQNLDQNTSDLSSTAIDGVPRWE